MSVRPAINDTTRRVYSARRLRIVAFLLTLIFLPIVVGSSLLIYQYQRMGVLVGQRLAGEKGRLPARVYARPFVLRPGMVLEPEGLVKALNRLRYAEREAPSEPGQFAATPLGVSFFPRPVLDGASEPIVVSFAADRQKVTRVRELRDRSKRKLAEQALEPELISHLYGEDREKRRRVRFEELPDHVVKAVLAIEDRRFFSHPGLDPIRLVGAMLRNLRSDSAIPHGGSTITQQLCKNFFLTRRDERGYRTAERSYRRKAQEALLAFVLERRASKQEILEMYLNEVYLGQAGSFGIYGIGEAARSYFGKDVTNLTLPEAALIAGMIQSPNPYNPFRHEKRATERRDEVIRAMRDAGFIDKAVMEEALAAPLLVERPNLDTTDAPYFVDLVGQQLAARYAARDLGSRNLSIYTSLDLHLQGLAQTALERGLGRVQELIKKRTSAPVQGSLIAIEPASGRLVALVGGRSYGRSQYNRVMQARRQPGSTFKPFVFLAAFEATFEDPSLPPITPATVVEDAPAVFFYEDKEYIPTNYEDEYNGMVTLRLALAKSLNVATVKVAEMVGFDKVADLWSKKLAIGAPIQPYPAVALGSFEATPFEMATAYNVLANGGLKVEPVTILRVADEKDVVLEQHRTPPAERVLREESAFLVTDMLRSVVREGTAAGAAGMGFTAAAAGKTGTTNDYRDAWFAGFTPDLLCVVWVGFDDNTPVGLSGTRAALPIWVDFMKAALAGRPAVEFPPPPEGIVFVEIDRDNGLLARPGCPRTRQEAFVAGTEPREPCGVH
jgi:penicillin-binding protein 1B